MSGRWTRTMCVGNRKFMAGQGGENIELRTGGEADMERAMAVMQECPEAPQWSRQKVGGGAEAARGVRTAQCPGGSGSGEETEWAGVAVVNYLEGDSAAELEVVGVRPGWRRHGVGRMLCEDVVRWARNAGVGVELEVRASNEAARGCMSEWGL